MELRRLENEGITHTGEKASACLIGGIFGVAPFFFFFFFFLFFFFCSEESLPAGTENCEKSRVVED